MGEFWNKTHVHEIILMVIFLSWTCVHGANYTLSEHCGRTLDMNQRGLSEVVLSLTTHHSYWSNAKCEMTIETAPGHHLSFRILELVLDDCGDMVSLYGDSTNSSDTLYAHMCTLPSHVYDYNTPGSQGIVTFSSNTQGHNGGFKILVTSFYNALNGACAPGYFKCKNRRCIKAGLKCNRRDNCGNNSDEPSNCSYRSSEKEEENRWWIPVASVFGGIALLVFICHLKKKHDMKVAVESAAAKAAADKKAAQAKSANSAKTNSQTPKDDKKTQGKQEDAKAVTDTPKQAETTKDTSSGTTQGDSRPIKNTNDPVKSQAATVSTSSTTTTTSTHTASSPASSVPLVESLTLEEVPSVTSATSAATETPSTSQPFSAPQNPTSTGMQTVTPMYVHVIPMSQPYIPTPQSFGPPGDTPPSYLTAMSGPPPLLPVSAWTGSMPLYTSNTTSLEHPQHGDYVVNLPRLEHTHTEPPTYTPEKSNDKY